MSADASGGGFRSQPEDEPIVVDNPEFAVDLLNADSLAGDGSAVIQRRCKGLSQILVFDSQGFGGAFLTFHLAKGAPLSVFLRGSGGTLEEVEFSKTSIQNGDGIQVTCKGGSLFKAVAGRTAKFKLDANPNRGIAQVKFIPLGATDPLVFPLNQAGRHIIFLIPGQ